MAVVKGTNSYVTIEEADAYFTDRANSSVWSAADSIKKGQALVTATRLLDDQPWAGTAIIEEQSLAFPRSGEYFDPRLGTLLSMPEGTPQRVITATYELAYHILINEDLLDNTGSVGSLNAGKISLNSIQKASVITAQVRNIIKPLLINSGSNSWWRAN